MHSVGEEKWQSKESIDFTSQWSSLQIEALWEEDVLKRGMCPAQQAAQNLKTGAGRTTGRRSGGGSNNSIGVHLAWPWPATTLEGKAWFCYRNVESSPSRSMDATCYRERQHCKESHCAEQNTINQKSTCLLGQLEVVEITGHVGFPVLFPSQKRKCAVVQ